MKNFDQYSSDLLEQAKRFLEKARVEKDEDGKGAYLTASLLVSFCSLEAFINGVITDFSNWNRFSIHEKALLLEKNVKFEKGEYVIQDQLQMSRLTDKIQLLIFKFGCKKNYRISVWWGLLNQGLDLRNSLSHPKEVKVITEKQVEQSIESIINCIDFVFKEIYKKGFPNSKRGLDSKFSF